MVPKDPIDIKATHEEEDKKLEANEKKAQREKAFNDAMAVARSTALFKERLALQHISLEKDMDKHRQEAKQTWDELLKPHGTIDELMKGGMAGYDDWVSGMCKILQACIKWQKAIYHGFTAQVIEPKLRKLVNLGELHLMDRCIWGLKDAVINGIKNPLSEKLGFRQKEEKPEMTCDINDIKIDEKGVVDLSSFTPKIGGIPLHEYFPDEATKEQVDLCRNFVLEGFKFWLNSKGYELDDKTDVKQPIIKKQVSAGTTASSEAIKADEFAGLNKESDTNLTSFLSGYLGRTINPEPEYKSPGPRA